MSLIYDSHGQHVATGTLLGKGGEGSVLEVRNRQNVVAKVYHQSVAPAHAAKLSAMARLATERLQRLSAWPIDTLHERPGGPMVGLLIPRGNGKLIHVLYGPKSRLAEFPTADWRFLIYAAANVARAVHVIHEHGHVIGDVNHGNLLVSDRATVMLIDCDSFQITLPDRQFICEVGIETHTPPELQGKRFREIVRTPNHDNFGLAVLIFQLLFMGRHPFSGAYLGAGEMPIPKAITEFRFAYGADALSRHMRPPPGTLALDASWKLARLFERAFSSQGSQADGRPKPHEWITGLDLLSRSLKCCDRNSGHFYLNLLASCPWCDIETRIGIVLFNVAVSTPTGQASFDLAVAWTRITEVVSPGPLPHLPMAPHISVAPSATSIALGRQYRQGWNWLTTHLGLNRQRAHSIANIRSVLQAANARKTELSQRWQTEAHDGAFRKKLQELEAKRKSYLSLPNVRAEKMRELEQNRERAQRYRYLDSIRIDDWTIPNIGQGRKATLQSFGIETAADVVESRILAIPGFGPTLTGYLTWWRKDVERQFRFNPAQGVDPRDIVAVETQINATRLQFENDFTAGPAELIAIRQQIQQRRTTLSKAMNEALMAAAQAQADLSVL